MKHSFIVLLSIFLIQCSGPQDEGYQNSVELKTIHERNQSVTSIQQKSKKYNQDVLTIKPDHQDNQLLIWKEGDKINWDKANYLVCEIYHTNNFSGVINVNFFKTGNAGSNIVTQSGQSSSKPQISAKIGILPDLKTKLIFPLSYLNGQNIFLDRYPRQLKGTVLGNRMKKEEISKITLNFAPYQKPHFTPSFEIASITFRDSLPGIQILKFRLLISSVNGPEKTGRERPKVRKS